MPDAHIRRRTVRGLIIRRALVLYVQVILAVGVGVGAIIMDHRPINLQARAAASVTPSTIPTPSPGVTAPGDAWSPISGWIAAVWHQVAGWAATFGAHWPATLTVALGVWLVYAGVALLRGQTPWPVPAILAWKLRGKPTVPGDACPVCGEPLEASDDAVTPHECLEAQR